MVHSPKPDLPDDIAAALAREARPAVGTSAPPSPADHDAGDEALHRELSQLEEHLRQKGFEQEAADVGILREHTRPFSAVGDKLGDAAAGLRDLATRQWKLFNRELNNSRE